MSHLEFLNDADCILLHYTTEDYDFENNLFISGSRTNAVKIVESIAEEGDKIPLVLFSNGMGEAVVNNENNITFIRGINKNVFYSRLYDFVEHYKNRGSVELRILAWGKNFQSKEVSSLANLLLGLLTHCKADDLFDITLFADRQKEFQRFIELSLVQDDISVIWGKLKKSDNSKRTSQQNKFDNRKFSEIWEKHISLEITMQLQNIWDLVSKKSQLLQTATIMKSIIG